MTNPANTEIAAIRKPRSVIRAEGQPYNDPHKPGRLDANGIEWWTCDPYPTWYRRVDGKLSRDSPNWSADEGNGPATAALHD